MSNHVEQQKKKSNPLLWFIFAIIIPLIVTLILIYTILMLAGVDVNNWLKNTGKKIPVISSMITTEEELNFQELEQKYNSLKESRESEISTMTTDIENYEATINRLENEIEELEAQVEFLKENQPTDAASTEAEADMIKKMSSSFKTMKPKQAALIFADLEINVAIQILKTLSNDIRGKILEAMDPKLAAQLTERMINEQPSINVTR